MKVVDYEVTVVGCPWRDLTFVELKSDDGLVGLGEVRMVNKTETLIACIRELAPRYVIGTDPFDLERLHWNVRRGEYGRAGEVAASALAAFDMASWDLIGQALDVPLWRLLGGKFRDRVPAYANGWYRTERDPGLIAEQAQKVIERGYRALKLDPFGPATVELSSQERRRSVEIVAAVREAVGPDIQLMIEMHGRFTAAEAIAVAQLLEVHSPAWIEEPIPPENPAGLEHIRRHTSVPIATGERIHSIHDFRELFERGWVDIVQADITHFGGLLPMKQLAGWADAYYLQMAPHNVCGPVGTAANVHFAVATPNFKILEHFNDFSDPWVEDLVDVAPAVSPGDGCFSVPTGTGLGSRLNHDACAEHPPTGGRIRLFEDGWEKRADIT